MSLMNLQNNIMKAAWVSQIQARNTDIARATDEAQRLFHDELARQADETVSEVTEVENEAIREEYDRGQEDPRRRRRNRRGPSDDDPEDDPPPEDDSESDDDRPDDGLHHINIIA